MNVINKNLKLNQLSGEDVIELANNGITLGMYIKIFLESTFCEGKNIEQISANSFNSKPKLKFENNVIFTSKQIYCNRVNTKCFCNSTRVNLDYVNNMMASKILRQPKAKLVSRKRYVPIKSGIVFKRVLISINLSKIIQLVAELAMNLNFSNKMGWHNIQTTALCISSIIKRFFVVLDKKVAVIYCLIVKKYGYVKVKRTTAIKMLKKELKDNGINSNTYFLNSAISKLVELKMLSINENYDLNANCKIFCECKLNA